MYSASNDYNINASVGSEKSSKIFYKDKNIDIDIFSTTVFSSDELNKQSFKVYRILSDETSLAIDITPPNIQFETNNHNNLTKVVYKTPSIDCYILILFNESNMILKIGSPVSRLVYYRPGLIKKQIQYKQYDNVSNFSNSVIKVDTFLRHHGYDIYSVDMSDKLNHRDFIELIIIEDDPDNIFYNRKILMMINIDENIDCPKNPNISIQTIFYDWE